MHYASYDRHHIISSLLLRFGKNRTMPDGAGNTRGKGGQNRSSRLENFIWPPANVISKGKDLLAVILGSGNSWKPGSWLRNPQQARRCNYCTSLFRWWLKRRFHRLRCYCLGGIDLTGTFIGTCILVSHKYLCWIE